MMRRALQFAVGAIVTGGLLAAPATAGPHTDTYSYVAPGGDAIAFNCDGALKAVGPGVGGLCFDILRGDTKVTVTINDDSGLPVAGQLRFRDPSNARIDVDRAFCGSTPELDIPTGADEILVWVQSAKAVPVGCNPATKGTMTGAFS